MVNVIFFSIAAEITTRFIFQWLSNPHRDPPAVTASSDFPQNAAPNVHKKCLYIPQKNTKIGKYAFFQNFSLYCCMCVLTVEMLKRNVFQWQCLKIRINNHMKF